MQPDETPRESRVRENFTHGLVYEAKPNPLLRSGTRKGFTLIELLVVVAIIGFLGANSDWAPRHRALGSEWSESAVAAPTRCARVLAATK